MTFLILRDDQATAEEEEGHREPSMGRAVERVFEALGEVDDANEGVSAKSPM